MYTIKKKLVPENNNTRKVEVVQSWSVEWKSHCDEYSVSIEKHKEFFLTEEEAENFKLSLIQAKKLLKYKYGSEPQVKKTCM